MKLPHLSLSTEFILTTNYKLLKKELLSIWTSLVFFIKITLLLISIMFKDTKINIFSSI
jgi:hypothetical protein